MKAVLSGAVAGLAMMLAVTFGHALVALLHHPVYLACVIAPALAAAGALVIDDAARRSGVRHRAALTAPLAGVGLGACGAAAVLHLVSWC